MFERFSRSWGLIKASAGVLAKDKELLVFPLLSAICTLIVAAAFLLPAFGLGALDGLREDEHVAGTGLDVRHFRFQRIELGFDRIVGVAVLHETVHVGSPSIGAERGPFEVELP